MNDLQRGESGLGVTRQGLAGRGESTLVYHERTRAVNSVQF